MVNLSKPFKNPLMKNFSCDSIDQDLMFLAILIKVLEILQIF
jgi:hypothetical protein